MMNYFKMFILLCPLAISMAMGQGTLKSNIAYYPESISAQDSYMQERCVLDVYVPDNAKGLPTLLWFHGGGLEGGNKSIPSTLKTGKFIVVAANYRFSPKVRHPAYIEDAAAATAWVFNHIGDMGGDANKIIITGHSAGGYLASMVGLDKSYLAKYNIDANRLAGIAPLSGHCITHMTVRKELGIGQKQPTIDKYAPLFHARGDAPPMLLITGDREMEMLGRYEENALMMRMMKLNGHQDVTLYEMDGYGHSMLVPAYLPLMGFANRVTSSKN
ncbi:acetyl esterase/lipase [Dyadobacter jejuensis]|uniref:Acetyl esterase/lipase n=1 Tax=Dyadobacter jejuensis TaxID=1082580 RepID=A0A316APS8_9BACT|nr:alpha/beta hydrolase [Dyadobacter jejuensis]PWJ58840.1 acetyl esterase/lipase [Dyadobacter jejuensis]